MSNFKIAKRTLCTAFIEHGKHISTAETYIRQNFNLSEPQLKCVIVNIQKYVLPEFKIRWKKAARKVDVFLKNNKNWLDSELLVQFEVSEEPSTSSGTVRGRPCKNFEESAETTQRRKAIKLFRDSGLDHIHRSYVQGLRSIGQTVEAEIIQELRASSIEKKEILLQILKKTQLRNHLHLMKLWLYTTIYL